MKISPSWQILAKFRLKICLVFNLTTKRQTQQLLSYFKFNHSILYQQGIIKTTKQHETSKKKF